MSFNSPPQFPLRMVDPQHDLTMVDPQGKVSDVCLQKQYQKLSIKGNNGGITVGGMNETQALNSSINDISSRESRKRIRNCTEFGSTDANGVAVLVATDDTDAVSSCTDVDMYNSDSEPASAVVALQSVSNFAGQANFQSYPSSGNLSAISAPVVSSFGSITQDNSMNSTVLHPPKRRLTTTMTDNFEVNQIQAPITRTTANPSFDRPRTPNAINSPTQTPISDFEEDPTQAQQLPLPSPSASPVQPDEEKPHKQLITTRQTGENHNLPSTQSELIEMMLGLSSSLNERNHNHLIFKLLQNVNRSALSTFSGLIDRNLKRDLISNLPRELSFKILGYLDHKTLLSVSRVCQNWFRVINNPTLWVNLLRTDKLITDFATIQRELANPQQLIREWSSSQRTISNLPQLLYKKRCIIINRWLDPRYEPKRITVAGHGAKVVTCLQHDDEKIVTGVDDKLINIYSTKTGSLLRVLEGHEGGVWALKYTGNTLVTGSTDRTVRIWNMKTGQCTHIFRGHTSTIRCLDILHPTVIGKDVNGADIVFPQFPLLVTGSRDHNLHVWKLPLVKEDDDDEDNISAPFDCGSDDSNPFLIAVLTGHTQSVRSVCGHGNIIISGSYDKSVRVWDLLDNGKCKHILSGHIDRVYSTAMDFASKKCFSGSMDSSINVWNFETGQLLNKLEGHTSLVGLLDLVDGVLVSAAADTTLRVWDPETGENKAKLEGHTGAITCFEHDGLRVVSGSERMLKLWDVKKGVYSRDLLGDVTGGIWQVRIDYKRCVAAVQRLIGEEEGETFIEILDFSKPLNNIQKQVENVVDCEE